MKAILVAPALTPDNLLAAIGAGDTTLPLLADTFDVPRTSFTLRRLAFALADRGLIRVVERLGEDDLLVVVS